MVNKRAEAGTAIGHPARKFQNTAESETSTDALPPLFEAACLPQAWTGAEIKQMPNPCAWTTTLPRVRGMPRKPETLSERFQNIWALDTPDAEHSYIKIRHGFWNGQGLQHAPHVNISPTTSLRCLLEVTVSCFNCLLIFSTCSLRIVNNLVGFTLDVSTRCISPCILITQKGNACYIRKSDLVFWHERSGVGRFHFYLSHEFCQT